MRVLAALVLALLLVLPARAGNPRDRALASLALSSSVALFATDKVQSGESFCSGVIIGPRQVLTASHCVHRGYFVDRTVVVTYDRKEHRATRIVFERRGWDLAVLEVADNLGGRVVPLTSDIAPGDTLLMVGSMDGEEFTLSYLRLSKIEPEVAFAVCEPDKYDGNEPHQMIMATGIVWGGNSGGGVFDEQGDLVGIITNMRITGAFECVKEEGKPPRAVVLWAGASLWAWIVGPETVAKFLQQKP